MTMYRFALVCLPLLSSAVLSGGFFTQGWAADHAELAFPASRWTKIHEQREENQVSFRRQAHGGSCFDSNRGRLVLFGSNTHWKDWSNSPLIFDVNSLRWSRVYANDGRETYAVNDQGNTVAGLQGNHPWAMHTYGAVVCDPSRDEMIVASAPRHMDGLLKKLNAIKPKFPTWTFNFKTNHWHPLPTKAIDFFPYCTAFDSSRNVVLGYRGGSIYELSGEPRSWKKLTKKTFLKGYHNSCAYDAQNKALIIFGTSKKSNDVEVFFPESGKHQIMPAQGVRPPQDQHVPMAFHPGIGKTVVIVDRKLDAKEKISETWLYDLAEDAWTKIPTATLPFACGMNYNLEYDAHNDQLLLVTGGNTQPTTVWALKLQTRP